MASFIIPREVYFGPGSLENIKKIKAKKAVIVTGGSSMKKSGVLDRTVRLLKEAEIESRVFDGVEPDPSVETVMKGTAFLNSEKPDLIIGLGGCSAIDAAKAMWVFYEHPETTFKDIIPPFTIKPLRKKARFAAIPSTSGTGTEVTCVSVITDRAKGVKYPVVSYEICPDIAIVDGELCVSMPPDVTANTGMDALAHDCEAYVATLASSYSDALAIESLKMIFKYLPVAYKDPGNIKARQIMHDASCMAGMSFTNAILGIVHSMAHQLGGMFGIPHGCANALLLPNVIRFNSKSTGKYIELARAVGKGTSGELAKAIEGLRKSVGVVDSIREWGVEEKIWREKLDAISKNALADPCTGTNPRKPTQDEIRKIYECCYIGTAVDF
jgi:alcohol dehydrogenase class IV